MIVFMLHILIWKQIHLLEFTYSPIGTKQHVIQFQANRKIYLQSESV